MGHDTDFEFGWNEADNLDPPWSTARSTSGASAGTERRTAQQASAVPASENTNANAIDIEFVCDYVKRELRALTREVRKVAHLRGNNMDINELIKRGNGDGQGTLLHGSDVPAKTRSFKIKIKEFRPAPEGFKGAVGIVDIDEVFGCTAWALNKTNAKALAGLLGPNTDKWHGKPVTLEKIKVQNPSKGTTVDSLAVQV